MIGTTITAEGYFSIAKIITMMIFITGSLATAPWVHRDSKRVQTSQSLWSVIAVGGIIVAMSLWVAVDEFIVGMLLFTAVVVATFGLYALYRNNKVDKSRRILTPSHIVSLLSRSKANRRQRNALARCKFYSADATPVLPPDNNADGAEIVGYNLAQEFFFDLLWYRANQVEIIPKGQMASVSYVIDGVACEKREIPFGDSQLLVGFLKKMGNMDLTEHRKPQKGFIGIEITEGEIVEIMLTTTGTTEGQRLGVKIVQEVVRTDIDSLGLTEKVYERLKTYCDKPGIIIVAGKASSGVTSTLYSLLRSQDAYIRRIETIEANTSADLDNVSQNKYCQNKEMLAMVSSSIKRGADVLMIDRCDDSTQAEIIRDASKNTTICLGVAASDSFTALAKWIKLNAGQGESLDCLNAVLCQFLVRKLCLNCREPYKPDPVMLAKANLSGNNIDRFFRPRAKQRANRKGNTDKCPQCQGTGYFGRTAVFELLEMTDEIRELIRSGKNLTQIKTACRKNKMLYLQEQALRKVISGETSIQEVLRMTKTKTKKKTKTS